MRNNLLLLLSSLLLACPSPRSAGSSDDDDVDLPALGDDDDASNDDDAADDDDASNDDDAADDDDASNDDDAVDDDDTAPDDDDATPVDDGPMGWIGAPCTSDSDCTYDDAVCLLDGEGFPRGTCSQGCDLYCPDLADRPTTFCVADADLPSTAPFVGDGACLSRCDFEYFPDTGCRPDYGCSIVERANESWTETYVCMPGADTDLTDCQLDLAARGVAFEPTIRAVDHPADLPNVDCIIDGPVWLKSPVLGVELRNTGGTETPQVLASCPMAQAVVDTVLDVLPLDVEAIRHIGTYNCRVIANTTTLSQHGLANAIDIYGFDFYDGRLWTLIDDWEDNQTTFNTDAGQWLYDTAYRWHDDAIWNIILTPNFNSAHDNHFHVDMTEGSDFIELLGPSWEGWFNDPRWIGPAPYSD